MTETPPRHRGVCITSIFSWHVERCDTAAATCLRFVVAASIQCNYQKSSFEFDYQTLEPHLLALDKYLTIVWLIWEWLMDDKSNGQVQRWCWILSENCMCLEECFSFAEAEPLFKVVTHCVLCLHCHLSLHSEGNNSSIVVEAFELATERRAREWQEYERVTSEKEVLRAHMEAEQRREEEQRQKEEVARLRQEQVTAESISSAWCWCV